MNEIPTVLDVRVVAGPGGGPDKTILNSPRYLRPAYRNLCAYLHPPGDPGFTQLQIKAERRGAPLLSIPDRGPLDWRVVPRLLEICRGERVRVWHGHDYKSNALGLLLRRFWPMRLVTTVHGWVHQTRRTPLYYGIDRYCLRRYPQVVCVSHDLYAECLDLGIPASRCALIENGIDLADYRRTLATGEAKERLGIPKDRLVVGGVGRLEAEKGFDVLIRAADALRRTGLDLHLVLVGAGSARPKLEALVAALGRSDRFQLAGYQADPLRFYQAMDVFALSSVREGLPNVLLEAMALDIPVAATAVNGVPRLIRDGENGLLVQPGSTHALTAALARMLGDADFRRDLAQAGRQTVEEEYSFRQRMEKIRKVYDGLLTGPERGAGAARSRPPQLLHGAPS